MKGLFQCPPKLLPLQGALLIAIIPRAMPWARSFWAFSPYLSHMRKFSKAKVIKNGKTSKYLIIFFLLSLIFLFS